MFPKFLLPQPIFRRRPRRRSSSSSTTDGLSSSPDEPSAAGAAPAHHKYLHGHISYLRCSRCAADLCLTSQIISKGFTGRHGRAYLVSADPTTSSAISVSASSPTTGSLAATLPNTITQRAVPRQLVTGAHTVSDISCMFCGSVLGWKYVAAEEEAQRYKVGKFILETKRIMTASCWEGMDLARVDHRISGGAAPAGGGGGGGVGGEEVQFDSQDEDECEDLFAGIWSPELARRRRRSRCRFDGERQVGVYGVS